MATVELPRNLLHSCILREDFEDKDDWSHNVGTVVANDATHHRTGTQSVQVTAPVGALGFITKMVGPWDFSNSDEFRIFFYANDPTTIQGFFIRFLDITLGKSLTHYPGADKLKRYSGWNLIVIKKTDTWNVAGSMDWSTPVAYLRLGVTSVAGQQAVVSWDGFYSDLVATPALMFTFDDANATVYGRAYSYMSLCGIPGTFYVKTSVVNAGSSFVRSTQLVEMQTERGWTIGNHTQNHVDLTALTEAQVEAEFQAAITDLNGWGINGRGPYHLACPFGLWNDTVLAAIEDINGLTHRVGIIDGYPYMPFDEPYKIPLTASLTNSYSLAQAKAWLDTAVDNNELAICVAHAIVDGIPGEYEWSVADFKALIDHVLYKQIPCITMDMAYRLQSEALTVTMPHPSLASCPMAWVLGGDFWDAEPGSCQ